MASLSSSTATLRTSDIKDFSVSVSVISSSETIKNNIDNDYASGVIPLPNINSQTLERVIEYSTKHTDEYISGTELKEFVMKFLNDLSRDDLFDLLLAAKYLHMESFFLALAEKAASLMRGETPEMFRRIFNVKSNFTKEEEKLMNNDNVWSLR